jgi:signal transduction histidine kinase
MCDLTRIPVWGTTPLPTLPNQKSIEPIAHIAQLLHQLPAGKLEAALQVVQITLQSQGLRLYIAPEALHTIGPQPKCLSRQRPIEQHILWQQFLHSDEDAWVIADLQLDFRLRSLAATFKPLQASHLMVLPLRHEGELIGCLSAYRDAPDRAWSPSEVDRAQQIAQHFATNIQHHRSVNQVHHLNTVLAQQSQELRQIVTYQQSLANVVGKIRASIDLNDIFRTTVQEIYELLGVDRAVVYRFQPDWSGEFVAEAVGSQWLPLQVAQHDTESLTKPDHCVVNSFPSQPITDPDRHLQDNQGANYRNSHDVRVVEDIYANNFADCYLETLEKYQCRAYMTAPIYHSDRLWGLLTVYQNATTRHWLTPEITLMGQIAAQLGIAIQQGELLAQSRSQAEALTTALAQVHHSQVQLIQTEKMSSLGQLVAGIAHEVNNPVNFVHGNLAHLKNYYQELLGLIELCQTHKSQLPQIIQGYTEAIDVDFIANDIPKLITSMQVGTNRISEIVISLRNFSRLDEAEMKRVDIHEGIDSTCLILKNQCLRSEKFANIELIRQYSDLPYIECYAGQLNQVIMNILSNAIEAIHEHQDQAARQIKIITEIGELHGRPSALIRIQDNGPGIAPGILGDIFNPFFTTKPVGKGTGLGLSISYQIITEKHNGELRCISQVGEGTEFQIEIPITIWPVPH